MAVQREYLSPNEIAELLGVSPFTIRRYIKLGELKAVKLLGGFRVHRQDLQRFLKAHEVNPTEGEIPAEGTETESAGPQPGALQEPSLVYAKPLPGHVPVRRAPSARSKGREPAGKRIKRRKE